MSEWDKHVIHLFIQVDTNIEQEQNKSNSSTVFDSHYQNLLSGWTPIHQPLCTGIWPVSYKLPGAATVQSSFLHLAHKDIPRDHPNTLLKSPDTLCQQLSHDVLVCNLIPIG